MCQGPKIHGPKTGQELRFKEQDQDLGPSTKEKTIT